MQYVSSTDARNNLSAMIDKVQREPLMIKKKGRDAAVIISPEDYEKLRRKNIEEFQVLCADIAKEARERGLTEEILNEILEDTD
jgi:prevent-host-death family protein